MCQIRKLLVGGRGMGSNGRHLKQRGPKGKRTESKREREREREKATEKVTEIRRQRKTKETNRRRAEREKERVEKNYKEEKKVEEQRRGQEEELCVSLSFRSDEMGAKTTERKQAAQQQRMAQVRTEEREREREMRGGGGRGRDREREDPPFSEEWLPSCQYRLAPHAACRQTCHQAISADGERVRKMS